MKVRTRLPLFGQRQQLQIKEGHIGISTHTIPFAKRENHKWHAHDPRIIIRATRGRMQEKQEPGSRRFFHNLTRARRNRRHPSARRHQKTNALLSSTTAALATFLKTIVSPPTNRSLAAAGKPRPSRLKLIRDQPRLTTPSNS